MSKVSYFQKYSQRENHITNNTLLLFKYIYQISSQKINTILQNLTDGDFSIGLQFENQTKGSNSVPDGSIFQEAFNIFFETKRGDDLTIQQIKNHIKTIQDKKQKGEINGKTYLICLTQGGTEHKDYIKDGDTEIIYTSFKKIIDIIEDNIDDWEINLREIIEDYKENLKNEGVINIINDYKIFVSACGKTLNLNKEFSMYYDRYDRPQRADSKYMGLYNDKTIKLIGKIDAVIIHGGDIDFEIERIEEKSKKEYYQQQIKAMISESKKQVGYDLLEKPHRFFISDNLQETNFIKKTKNGLMGLKYIDLKNFVIKKDDNIENIAKSLNGKGWE